MFASIRSLPGIGQKVYRLFAKLLNVKRAESEICLVDFLHFLPHSVINRSNCSGIAYAAKGKNVILKLIIDRHHPPSCFGKRNMPYRVLAHDNTGNIMLVFFHAQHKWLLNQLPVGEKIVISGRVEWFNNHAFMVHPDHIISLADSKFLTPVEPVYPLTAGLSSKTVSKAMIQALNRIPSFKEWQDEALLRREQFPTYREALTAIHMPDTPLVISATSPARRRLAYDELLANQLALALVRCKRKHLLGRRMPLLGTYLETLYKALPFRLTQSQEQAFAEISQDLAAPQRMLRLLQGDVGSGKTIVALLAMAQVAESGVQSALMAPTEVLAQQHYANIAFLAEKVGLKITLLTGREKGRERASMLKKLSSNNIHIVIGTHALIQEEVDFHDLAFVIIDEQHRFGVHQRLQLMAKGDMPNMLVMTATPIPRTLTLTAFGDMDISKLLQKPIGRKPIKTAIISTNRMAELLQRMKDALERGEKFYWICPVIEESKNINLISTIGRFEILAQKFGNLVGLVHGKMSIKQKDAAMTNFKLGKIRLLVATTIVEVGVDIPDASIIIIEHAERFGLAQLHQLRGRVGRNDRYSSCTLLYKEPLSSVARARLNIMRNTEDGFRIAEEDLHLRGEGDLFGTKQSGMPGFRFVDMEAHKDLLEIAQKDARSVLERDNNLESPRGKALRVLLYLFRRDNAIRLLRSG